MGGQGSDMFEYFKLLILQGLIAARKHSDRILSIVDIMRAGKKPHIKVISTRILRILIPRSSLNLLIIIYNFIY